MAERPTHPGVEAGKIMLTIVGTAISSVGLMIALHSHFILPSTLYSVRQLIREEVRLHSEHPHPTSVPREVFDRQSRDMTKILDANQLKLLDLEILLKQIEKRVK